MIKILKKKFIFKPYKKVDIVILDGNCSNLKFDFLKSKTINSTEINCYHLMISFLKFIFSFNRKKKLSDFYFIEIIKNLNPKIGLGCEVDYKIFKFIKYFPKKISILYQFTFYNFKYKKITQKNILNNLETKKVKCNYFFIWNKKFKNYFDYFDTKFIVNGSTRNNEVETKPFKKKYDIMFISEFRRPVKSYYGTNNHYLSMKLIDATCSYILKILEKLRLSNKRKICVALTSNRKEKINKISRVEENKFIKRDLKKYYTEDSNSYNIAEKSKIIISLHSTLGPELLARGHKVLILNPDHFFFNADFLRIYKYPFINISHEESNIIKNIEKLISLNDTKWKQILNIKNFPIPFNKNNQIIKTTLKDILKK